MQFLYDNLLQKKYYVDYVPYIIVNSLLTSVYFQPSSHIAGVSPGRGQGQ